MSLFGNEEQERANSEATALVESVENAFNSTARNLNDVGESIARSFATAVDTNGKNNDQKKEEILSRITLKDTNGIVINKSQLDTKIHKLDAKIATTTDEEAKARFEALKDTLKDQADKYEATKKLLERFYDVKRKAEALDADPVLKETLASIASTLVEQNHHDTDMVRILYDREIADKKRLRDEAKTAIEHAKNEGKISENLRDDLISRLDRLETSNEETADALRDSDLHRRSIIQHDVSKKLSDLSSLTDELKSLKQESKVLKESGTLTGVEGEELTRRALATSARIQQIIDSLNELSTHAGMSSDQKADINSKINDITKDNAALLGSIKANSTTNTNRQRINSMTEDRALRESISGTNFGEITREAFIQANDEIVKNMRNVKIGDLSVDYTSEESIKAFRESLENVFDPDIAADMLDEFYRRQETFENQQQKLISRLKKEDQQWGKMHASQSADSKKKIERNMKDLDKSRLGFFNKWKKNLEGLQQQLDRLNISNLIKSSEEGKDNYTETYRKFTQQSNLSRADNKALDASFQKTLESIRHQMSLEELRNIAVQLKGMGVSTDKLATYTDKLAKVQLATGIDASGMTELIKAMNRTGDTTGELIESMGNMTRSVVDAGLLIHTAPEEFASRMDRMTKGFEVIAAGDTKKMKFLIENMGTRMAAMDKFAGGAAGEAFSQVFEQVFSGGTLQELEGEVAAFVSPEIFENIRKAQETGDEKLLTKALADFQQEYINKAWMASKGIKIDNMSEEQMRLLSIQGKQFENMSREEYENFKLEARKAIEAGNLNVNGAVDNYNELENQAGIMDRIGNWFGSSKLAIGFKQMFAVHGVTMDDFYSMVNRGFAIVEGLLLAQKFNFSDIWTKVKGLGSNLSKIFSSGAEFANAVKIAGKAIGKWFLAIEIAIALINGIGEWLNAWDIFKDDSLPKRIGKSLAMVGVRIVETFLNTLAEALSFLGIFDDYDANSLTNWFYDAMGADKERVNKVTGQGETQIKTVGGTKLPSGVEPSPVDMSNRQYAQGLSYVPEDNYLASLHKGEAILTAKDAEGLRKTVKADGGINAKALNISADELINQVATTGKFTKSSYEKADSIIQNVIKVDSYNDLSDNMKELVSQDVFDKMKKAQLANDEKSIKEATQLVAASVLRDQEDKEKAHQSFISSFFGSTLDKMGVADKFYKSFTEYSESFKGFKKVWGKMKESLSKLFDAFKTVFSPITRMLHTIFGSGSGSFSYIIEGFKLLLSPVIAISGFLLDTGFGMLTGILNFISSGIETVADIVGGIADIIEEWFGRTEEEKVIDNLSDKVKDGSFDKTMIESDYISEEIKKALQSGDAEQVEAARRMGLQVMLDQRKFNESFKDTSLDDSTNQELAKAAKFDQDATNKLFEEASSNVKLITVVVAALEAAVIGLGIAAVYFRKDICKYIAEIPTKIANFFRTTIVDKFTAFFNSVLNWLKGLPIVGPIVTKIGEVFNKICDYIGNKIAGPLNALKERINALKERVRGESNNETPPAIDSVQNMNVQAKDLDIQASTVNLYGNNPNTNNQNNGQNVRDSITNSSTGNNPNTNNQNNSQTARESINNSSNTHTPPNTNNTHSPNTNQPNSSHSGGRSGKLAALGTAVAGIAEMGSSVNDTLSNVSDTISTITDIASDASDVRESFNTTSSAESAATSTARGAQAAESAASSSRGILGTMKGLGSKALKFAKAGGPLAVLGTAYSLYEGASQSEEVLGSDSAGAKVATAIGSALGGSAEGGITNALIQAASLGVMGAGFGGPIGAAIGASIGLVGGFIGRDTISKALYSLGGGEVPPTDPTKVEGAMADGGTVPKTGLYVLSAGEQVIPTDHIASDKAKENKFLSTMTKVIPGLQVANTISSGLSSVNTSNVSSILSKVSPIFGLASNLLPPILGNYAEGTGIWDKITSFFSPTQSATAAVTASVSPSATIASSGVSTAAGSYGLGSLSSISSSMASASSSTASSSAASASNTAITNDILVGYTRGFSKYAGGSMKLMGKEPGILLKGYGKITEGSTKSIVAAIADPSAAKALLAAQNGTGSAASSSSGSVKVAKGAVESLGDTSKMNEAEQKAWKAAMIVGAKTGLPPELFYAQFIHESGRKNDWHYQDNNLGGVKFAGQAGAVSGSAAPASEGGGTYAKFNSIEDYANYYADTLLAKDFGDVLEKVQKLAASGASKGEIIKAYAYELGNAGYYGDGQGAATDAQKENYYSDMLAIASEAPTDYKIKPLSDGSMPVTIQGMSNKVEQNFQGLDEKYLDLSYAKEDLNRTNLENLQPVVKTIMNNMAKDIYERTGVKPVITGGAETNIHAPGEYGHEGGWKIDIGTEGISREVIAEVAAKYGVAVGDEDHHYDIAFSQHGGHVGGTQLTESAVGSYAKGTICLPTDGPGAPFPIIQSLLLQALAQKAAEEQSGIPIIAHPGEAILPADDAENFRQFLQYSSVPSYASGTLNLSNKGTGSSISPKQSMAIKALAQQKQPQPNPQDDMESVLTNKKRRRKRRPPMEAMMGGQGGRKKSPKKESSSFSGGGSISASIAGTGGFSISGGGGTITLGSLGGGGAAAASGGASNNNNGPGGALDWKKVADTYLGGKWVSKLSGNKTGSIGCADFTSNALTTLGLNVGAVPSVEELQKKLAGMGFELKVNPGETDLEEGDVLGYLGNVDYSKVDWKNPDLSGNTEGSATAGHIGLVGPGGASLQNSSGFSDDKAAPMMTGRAQDIVGNNWGTNKTLLIKTSKYFKGSGMTAADLKAYLEGQGIRVGGSELAEDSSLAGSTKGYSGGSSSSSSSDTASVSNTVAQGLQATNTPDTSDVDLSALGPMGNVALMASAKLKEKGINVPPSLLWAQMQYETGGDENYKKVVQEKLGGVDDHNYGGFTWYEGMGEQYKGAARPADEGGYYAKFSSDEEYATYLTDKVLGNGTFDINNKTTALDYATALKNGKDGAAYYAGGTPEEYAQGMTNMMSGKEDLLKALDAKAGAGATSLGGKNAAAAAVGAAAGAAGGTGSVNFSMPSISGGGGIAGGSVSASGPKLDKKNPVPSGIAKIAMNTEALVKTASKGFGGVNKGLAQVSKVTAKSTMSAANATAKAISAIAARSGGGGAAAGGAAANKLGNKSSGGATTASGSDNKSKIWNFLKDKMGLNDVQIAGVLGNFMRESGENVDPGLEEDTPYVDKGYGIAQWTFERRTALEEFAKSKGKKSSDLDVQLEFLQQELTGSYSDTVDKLKKATTIEEAVKIFHDGFERSADPNMDKRNEFAKQVYKDKVGKAPVLAEGTQYALPEQADNIPPPPADHFLAYLGLGEAVIPKDLNPFSSSGTEKTIASSNIVSTANGYQSVVVKLLTDIRDNILGSKSISDEVKKAVSKLPTSKTPTGTATKSSSKSADTTLEKAKEAINSIVSKSTKKVDTDATKSKKTIEDLLTEYIKSPNNKEIRKQLEEKMKDSFSSTDTSDSINKTIQSIRDKFIKTTLEANKEISDDLKNVDSSKDIKKEWQKAQEEGTLITSEEIKKPENPLDKFTGGEYFNRPDKVADIVRDFIKPDSKVKIENVMKELGIKSMDEQLTAEQQQKLGFREFSKVRTMEHYMTDLQLHDNKLMVDDWIAAHPEAFDKQKEFDKEYEDALAKYNEQITKQKEFTSELFKKDASKGFISDWDKKFSNSKLKGDFFHHSYDFTGEKYIEALKKEGLIDKDTSAKDVLAKLKELGLTPDTTSINNLLKIKEEDPNKSKSMLDIIKKSLDTTTSKSSTKEVTKNDIDYLKQFDWFNNMDPKQQYEYLKSELGKDAKIDTKLIKGLTDKDVKAIDTTIKQTKDIKANQIKKKELELAKKTVDNTAKTSINTGKSADYSKDTADKILSMSDAIKEMKFDQNDIDYLKNQEWTKGWSDEDIKKYLIENSDKYKKDYEAKMKEFQKNQPDIAKQLTDTLSKTLDIDSDSIGKIVKDSIKDGKLDKDLLQQSLEKTFKDKGLDVAGIKDLAKSIDDKGKLISSIKDIKPEEIYKNMKFDQNDIDYLKSQDWTKGWKDEDFKKYLAENSDKYKKMYDDTLNKLKGQVDKGKSSSPYQSMIDQIMDLQKMMSSIFGGKSFNKEELMKLINKLPTEAQEFIKKLLPIDDVTKAVKKQPNTSDTFNKGINSITDQAKNLIGNIFKPHSSDYYKKKMEEAPEKGDFFHHSKKYYEDKYKKALEKEGKTDTSNTVSEWLNSIDKLIYGSLNNTITYSSELAKLFDEVSKDPTNKDLKDKYLNYIKEHNIQSDEIEKIADEWKKSLEKVKSLEPPVKPENPLDKFTGGEYFNRPDKVASIVKDYLKPDSNVKMEDIMKELGVKSMDEVLTAEQQQKLGFREYSKIRTMEHFDTNSRLWKEQGDGLTAVEDWTKHNPEAFEKQKEFDKKYDDALAEYEKQLKEYNLLTNQDNEISKNFVDKWDKKFKNSTAKGDFFHHSYDFTGEKYIEALKKEGLIDKETSPKEVISKLKELGLTPDTTSINNLLNLKEVDTEKTKTNSKSMIDLAREQLLKGDLASKDFKKTVEKISSSKSDIMQDIISKMTFDQNDIDYLKSQDWTKGWKDEDFKKYLIENSDKYKKEYESKKQTLEKNQIDVSKQLGESLSKTLDIDKDSIDKIVKDSIKDGKVDKKALQSSLEKTFKEKGLDLTGIKDFAKTMVDESGKILDNIKKEIKPEDIYSKMTFDQNDIDYLKSQDWTKDWKDEDFKKYLIENSDKYKKMYDEAAKELEAGDKSTSPFNSLIESFNKLKELMTNASNSSIDMKDLEKLLDSLPEESRELLKKLLPTDKDIKSATKDIKPSEGKGLLDNLIPNLGNTISNIFKPHSSDYYKKKMEEAPEKGDFFHHSKKYYEEKYKKALEKEDKTDQPSLLEALSTLGKKENEQFSQLSLIFEDLAKDPTNEDLRSKLNDYIKEHGLQNEDTAKILEDWTKAQQELKPPKNPLDDFEGGEYFNRPDKVAEIVRDFIKPDSKIKTEDVMKELGIKSMDDVLTAEQQQKLGFREFSSIRTMNHYLRDLDVYDNKLMVDSWVEAHPEAFEKQKEYDKKYDEALAEYNKKTNKLKQDTINKLLGRDNEDFLRIFDEASMLKELKIDQNDIDYLKAQDWTKDWKEEDFKKYLIENSDKYKKMYEEISTNFKEKQDDLLKKMTFEQNDIDYLINEGIVKTERDAKEYLIKNSDKYKELFDKVAGELNQSNTGSTPLDSVIQNIKKLLGDMSSTLSSPSFNKEDFLKLIDKLPEDAKNLINKLIPKEELDKLLNRIPNEAKNLIDKLPEDTKNLLNKLIPKEELDKLLNKIPDKNKNIFDKLTEGLSEDAKNLLNKLIPKDKLDKLIDTLPDEAKRLTDGLPENTKQLVTKLLNTILPKPEEAIKKLSEGPVSFMDATLKNLGKGIKEQSGSLFKGLLGDFVGSGITGLADSAKKQVRENIVPGIKKGLRSLFGLDKNEATNPEVTTPSANSGASRKTSSYYDDLLQSSLDKTMKGCFGDTSNATPLKPTTDSLKEVKDQLTDNPAYKNWIEALNTEGKSIDDILQQIFPENGSAEDIDKLREAARKFFTSEESSGDLASRLSDFLNNPDNPIDLSKYYTVNDENIPDYITKGNLLDPDNDTRPVNRSKIDAQDREIAFNQAFPNGIFSDLDTISKISKELEKNQPEPTKNYNELLSELLKNNDLNNNENLLNTLREKFNGILDADTIEKLLGKQLDNLDDTNVSPNKPIAEHTPDKPDENATTNKPTAATPERDVATYANPMTTIKLMPNQNNTDQENNSGEAIVRAIETAVTKLEEKADAIISAIKYPFSRGGQGDQPRGYQGPTSFSHPGFGG